jgi:GxxExxY protein
MEPIDEELNHRVIGACMEVHRQLGPGLFERVYSDCLCHELTLRMIPFRKEVFVPITYKALEIQDALRLDILIEEKLVLELKSVEKIENIHKMQLATYLKLGNYPVGLLVNFNVACLKNGVSRILPPRKPGLCTD